MLSFKKLWASHPTVKGEQPLLDKKTYENQCAINLHAAFERSGVNLKTFHGQLSWQKDKPKYAIRAQELANWLASPFSGMHRAEKFSGQEVFDKIQGKGIIYFQNFWGPGNQGDHIDLWNGSRLTDRRSWARIHLRIGSFGVHSVIPDVSDLQKSQSVWFWPVSEPVG